MSPPSGPLRTPLSRGVTHSFFEQAESKARVTLPPTANNWERYLSYSKDSRGLLSEHLLCPSLSPAPGVLYTCLHPPPVLP